jgi:hypothetical protein
LTPPPSALVLGAAALLFALLLSALIAVRGRRVRKARSNRARLASEPAALARAEFPASTFVAGPAVATDVAAVRLSEAELAAELRRRLVGIPFDAPSGAAGESAPPAQVIWVESGYELLVHLDSLAVRVRPGLLLASLDVEADRMGRTTVVTPFALSEPGKGGLVAITEERPRGDPAVLAHWGTTLQEAIWAALLGIAADAADQQGHLPTELAAGEGALYLRSEPFAVHTGAAAE